MSKRLQAMGVEKYKDNFEVRTHEDALKIPYTWNSSKVVFVNSMSDLFLKKSDLNSYAWRDLDAVAGNNFYRIRSVGSDGETKYSQIIKVSMGKDKPAYEVYPNPVANGTIQLQFINQVKGVYQVRLLNTFGQVMLTDQIAHEQGSSMETIKPGRHIVKGGYILEVTAHDKSRQSIKIIY